MDLYPVVISNFMCITIIVLIVYRLQINAYKKLRNRIQDIKSAETYF